MKTKALIVLSVFLMGYACKGPQGKKSETSDAQEVMSAEVTMNYQVVPAESAVHWTGSKPTGEHYGTVNVQKGVLNVDENTIVGGSFVMDMTSIKVEDIEDPEMNQKLEGHLKSADFFNVDTFSTASFEITKVQPVADDPNYTHKISGNLSIKSSSKNISFLAKVEITPEMVKANTERFVIDRTKWNVNYQSKSVFDNLKEQFIHDEVALEVKLKAQP
jgi:polyisoprenoid-binding protein YceI